MLKNAVLVTLNRFPRVFVICTLRLSDSHLALAFCHIVTECISIAFNIFSLHLHALNQTLAIVNLSEALPRAKIHWRALSVSASGSV